MKFKQKKSGMRINPPIQALNQRQQQDKKCANWMSMKHFNFARAITVDWAFDGDRNSDRHLINHQAGSMNRDAEIVNRSPSNRHANRAKLRKDQVRDFRWTRRNRLRAKKHLLEVRETQTPFAFCFQVNV